MTQIGKWHDMETEVARLEEENSALLFTYQQLEKEWYKQRALITELANALEEQLVKQDNTQLFPWSIIHRAREIVKE